MIKYKYIICAAAAVMISAIILSGCGSRVNSAEELIAEMNSQIADTQSFEADVNFVLDMDYVLSGSSDNMKLDFNEKIITVLDTNETYIDGSMTVSDVYDEEWQNYLVEKGSGYASYTCSNGEWYYDDVDREYLSEGPAGLFDILMDISNYSFKNNSNYVAEAEVDSETVISILNSLYSNIIESAFSEGLDTSEMTAKIIVQVDKDTCLPKNLILVFNDCTDMFTGENMFDDVTVNEFMMSVVFDNYNETDDIDIPANVEDLFEFPEEQSSLNELESSSGSEEESSLNGTSGEPGSTDGELTTAGETENGSIDIEPMTFDDADDIVADAEGYYELSDYGGGKAVSLSEPAGFKFNRESDDSLISFDKAGKSDGYCSAVYELSLLSDGYTKADVEGYIENICNFYASDDAYRNMEYTGVKNIESAGRTINYSGLKYYYSGDEYSDAGYFIMYSYWTYMGDYVLVCNVTDYSANRFDEFNETEMAGVLFENIKE